MMSGSWIRSLDACAKEVFYSSEDERGMVDSIDVRAEKVAGHLTIAH